MDWSLVTSLYCCLFIGKLISLTRGSFDPFMESHHHAISWGGPLELEKEEIELLGDRHVYVTTNKKEQYQCILPKDIKETEAKENQYSGLSDTQLLQPLFNQKDCSYRIESYWTYELCHGKHLRQYHETREPGSKPKIQEFFLGLGNHRNNKDNDELKNKEEEKKPLPSDMPVRELDGEEMPFYEVIMSDGTKCDLTNQPRKAHVLYVCYRQGRGELYEFKEISTCEYEVIVLTSLLCKHPDYKPKPKAVSEIKCYSFLGSPIKPSQLVANELDPPLFQKVNQEFSVSDQQSESPAKPPQKSAKQEDRIMFHRKAHDEDSAGSTTPTPTPPKIGAFTDKQTLRDFFSGTRCLTGGQGWWKHEICFGKYAKQFHRLENGKYINIYLGFWNKNKHLQWLKENPLKRPKELSLRRSVSVLYTSGDVCDLTGKPRTCEVRLRCFEDTKSPHAVMLSLAEPSPCNYILTVDSALFCPILKNANDEGIFENFDL